MNPRPQTIPVLLLVKTAFQLFWQQRDDALRLGLAPTLLLFGAFLYGAKALPMIDSTLSTGIPSQVPPGVAMPIFISCALALISGSLLVVNWLRFLLLGPMGAIGVGLIIGRHHLRFLLATVAFGLVLVAVLLVLGIPLMFVSRAVAAIAVVAIIVVVMIVTARLLPFLIAQAIAQPLTLAQSWNVSRGNGLSLAMGLVLVQVPFALGTQVLQLLLTATGFSSLAPAGMLFIAAMVQIACAICQAGVMATAYRHMVGVRV